MSLELKLMQDLDPEQKKVAAHIVRYSGAPEITDFVVRSFVDSDDPLYEGPDTSVVIAAVEEDGNVVGVYDIPYFTSEYGLLANTLPGYLATKPQGKRNGNKVIASLSPIFQALGRAKGVPMTHAIGANSKTSLYKRNGYKYKGIGETGEWKQLRIWQKEYFPQEQQLGANQKRIVDAFLQRIVEYSKPPQDTSITIPQPVPYISSRST